MPLRLRTLFLIVVVLVISAAAAGPRRTLQATRCQRACDAASSGAAKTLETMINQRRGSICGCKCRGGGAGWTPMHVAAQSDCDACLGLMIDAPSNCNKMVEDTNGNTILHIGAQFCRTTTIAEAIRWYGLSVDLENFNGDTALCIAASQNIANCGGIVRNLMKRGAKMCFKCSDGKTPCERCGHPHVCNVLKVDGACNCP